MDSANTLRRFGIRPCRVMLARMNDNSCKEGSIPQESVVSSVKVKEEKDARTIKQELLMKIKEEVPFYTNVKQEIISRIKQELPESSMVRKELIFQIKQEFPLINEIKQELSPASFPPEEIAQDPFLEALTSPNQTPLQIDSESQPITSQEVEILSPSTPSIPQPPHYLSEILAQCNTKFRGHRMLSSEIVELNCFEILKQYKEKSAEEPSRSTPSEKTMTINYYQHLLKNQTELNNFIELGKHGRFNSKKKNLNDECGELNTHVEKFLTLQKLLPIPTDEIKRRDESKKTAKANGRRLAKRPPIRYYDWRLISGTSQLQSILRPQFSKSVASTLSKYPVEEPWRDKWHPVNLTMPFLLFSLTLNGSVSGEEQRMKLGPLGKCYIEYMAKVSESNQEFLLATISAFGKNVKSYPDRVLEKFEARDMLISACRLQTLLLPDEDNDDEIIPNRNRNSDLFPKRMMEEGELDNSGSEDQEESNIVQERPIEGNSAEKNALKQGDKYRRLWEDICDSEDETQVCELTRNDFASILKDLGVGTCKWWKRDFRHLVPRELFTTISNKVLKSFNIEKYSSENTLTEASDLWYIKIQATAETSRKCIQRAVHVCLSDNKDSTHHQIQKLSPQEQSSIRNGTRSILFARSKIAQVLGIDLSIPHQLMRSQTSFLQLLLLEYTKNGNHIPHPEKWDPFNCHFPFEAFAELLKSRFSLLDTPTPCELGSLAIKVRYVECCDQIFLDDHKQFLLGLFTAFGPHVLDYPVRALSILFHRGLCDGWCKEKKRRFFNVYTTYNYKPTSFLPLNHTFTCFSITSRVEDNLAPLLATSEEPQWMEPSKVIASFKFWNFAFSELVTREWFAEIAKLILNNFYGDQNDVISQLWYDRLEGTVERNQHVIRQTLNICLNDNRELAYLQIQKMIPAEQNSIRRDTLHKLRARQKSTPWNAGLDLSIPNQLMMSQTSYLQLLLVDHPNKTRNLIPNLTDWSPRKCHFPFEAFEQLLKSRFKLLRIPIKMSPLAIKIRYLECYDQMFPQDDGQFLLGLFSAFGPHLLHYPVRALSLLIQRGICDGWGKQEKLQFCGVGTEDVKLEIFLALDHKFPISCNEETNVETMRPEINIQKPADGVVETETTGSNCPLPDESLSSRSFLSPQQEERQLPTTHEQNIQVQVQPPTPPVPVPTSKADFLSVSGFEGWRNEVENGLLSVHLPVLPEHEYTSTYLHVLKQANTNSSEFTQGIYTGMMAVLQSLKIPLPKGLGYPPGHQNSLFENPNKEQCYACQLQPDFVQLNVPVAYTPINLTDTSLPPLPLPQIFVPLPPLPSEIHPQSSSLVHQTQHSASKVSPLNQCSISSPDSLHPAHAQNEMKFQPSTARSSKRNANCLKLNTTLGRGGGEMTPAPRNKVLLNVQNSTADTFEG